MRCKILLLEPMINVFIFQRYLSDINSVLCVHPFKTWGCFELIILLFSKILKMVKSYRVDIVFYIKDK